MALVTRYELTQAMLEGVLEKSALAELTDSPDENPTEAGLNVAFKLAEDEFESYAAIYHPTPVRTADGSVPPFVQSQLAQLVVYYLLSRKGWLGESGSYSYFRPIRKDLLAWMRSLAHPDGGRRTLIAGAVEKSVPENAAADEVLFEAPEPLRMTRSSLKGVF